MRDKSSVRLLLRWRDTCDEAAVAEFMRRYASRMIALVSSRMPGKYRRRFDAEDVVQSAFRSFCIRVRDGRLTVDADESLWTLLAKIAICKLINQVCFHRAAKRSVDHEDSATAIRADEPWHAAAADSEPRPEDVLALEEERERILQEFLPLHRAMIWLHLQNYSPGEIAQKTHRTGRTVSDVIKLFRKRLCQRLQELST